MIPGLKEKLGSEQENLTKQRKFGFERDFVDESGFTQNDHIAKAEGK